MKVKIEVDLSECYAENFEYDSDLGANPTSSLSDEVIDVIKYEVRNAIAKQIRDDVSVITKKAYEDFGEEKIKDLVAFKMEEFMSSGVVSDGGHNNETIPINTRLRKIFDNSSSWNNPYKAMEDIGKKFSEECRNRYDMAFASNIVRGLNNQGLLKPGVLEAITTDKTGE